MSPTLTEDLTPYQNKAKFSLELKLSLVRKSRGLHCQSFIGNFKVGDTVRVKFELSHVTKDCYIEQSYRFF